MTNIDPGQGESLAQRLFMPTVFVVSLLLIVAALSLTWFRQARPLEIQIATGVEHGTYFRIGDAITRLVNETLSNSQSKTIHTTGSPENIARLLDKQVNLAFIQNDAEGNDQIRTVARLYDEVVQILVSVDAPGGATPTIERMEDLRGKRIFLGPRNSGTAATAKKILLHYGLDLETDKTAYEVVDELPGIPTNVDAAFFLAGLPTPRVKQLLETGQFRLLSLGDPQQIGSRLEGLCFDLPGMKPVAIPAHSYRLRPERPVGSVAVGALLVTRADLPDYQVRKITELLFEQKFSLVREHPAIAEMSEINHAKGLRFPLHPGAANFYARNEPPFVVTYAETLSLLCTLLIGLFSGIWALRGLRRKRRKDRIDEYYLRVDEIAREIADDLPPDRLRILRTQLAQLRRSAFHDLVAERIEADESFSIFQDFLGQQLLDIQQILDRLRRTSANGAVGASP
jgi:uncharacterized protein